MGCCKSFEVPRLVREPSTVDKTIAKGKSVEERNKQLREFLYFKGVLSYENEEIRNAKFNALLYPVTEYYMKARGRLERIVTTNGDAHSVTLPQDIQRLEDFLRVRSIWRRYIHRSVRRYPVQQVQRSSPALPGLNL